MSFTEPEPKPPLSQRASLLVRFGASTTLILSLLLFPIALYGAAMSLMGYDCPSCGGVLTTLTIPVMWLLLPGLLVASAAVSLWSLVKPRLRFLLFAIAALVPSGLLNLWLLAGG